MKSNIMKEDGTEVFIYEGIASAPTVYLDSTWVGYDSKSYVPLTFSIWLKKDRAKAQSNS
ncbi:hypothetical protein [Candidatus Enterococcus mansonii]